MVPYSVHYTPCPPGIYKVNLSVVKKREREDILIEAEQKKSKTRKSNGRQ